MANSTVLLERNGPIARVILNRPEVLNAVNRDLIAGIRDAFGELEHDNDVRVVILTGAGRGFSSGGDLKKAPEAANVAHEDPLRSLREEMGENPRVLSVLQLDDKFVIAAINGPAVGVGLEIAMAADYRIAKSSVKVAFTQSIMGMVPMYAFGLLPPLMRLPDIKKFILLGEFVQAEEALRIGLVDQVVPDDKFEEEVDDLAQRMAKVQPQVIWVTKRALNERVVADTLSAINALEYAEFWLRIQKGHGSGVDTLRARIGLPPASEAQQAPA